jgi:hypothetical protein
MPAWRRWYKSKMPGAVPACSRRRLGFQRLALLSALADAAYRFHGLAYRLRHVDRDQLSTPYQGAAIDHYRLDIRGLAEEYNRVTQIADWRHIDVIRADCDEIGTFAGSSTSLSCQGCDARLSHQHAGAERPEYGYIDPQDS